MLKIALDREHITKQEFDILTYIVKKDDMCMKAEELDKLVYENQRKIKHYDKTKR